MGHSSGNPKHVAIIMDGNGRWAQERGIPRSMGHLEGARRVREIVRAASECGVRTLTLYAFSSENWVRPVSEVKTLMQLFVRYLSSELRQLNKNKVRLRFIGRQHPLPKTVLEKIRLAERTTERNTGLQLVLAINYGSRQEIVDAVRRLCGQVQAGRLAPADIDEEKISQALYTADMPDPDLLIRTSGEQRVSNFLLWQISYSELVFVQKLWPDFHKEDLEDAIEVYRKRRRKFGGI